MTTVSMAQLTEFDLGNGAYSIYIHCQGFLDYPKIPHVHLYYRSNCIAQISIDGRFEVITPGMDRLQAHLVYVEKVKKIIEDNLGYFHYLWDVYSCRTDYESEWKDDNVKSEAFKLRHDNNPPKRTYGKKWGLSFKAEG